MVLTVRTNGSGGSNLIQASWWNDYYNLLTGGMSDQEVTINNNLVLKGLGGAPSTNITGSAVSGGSLGIGIFGYGYSYVSPDGESPITGFPGITTSTGNQQIQLNIGTGPTGVTGRNIYRTAVGGGTNYRFCHLVPDNTTTVYVDNNPDASLGATGGTNNTLGGSLILKDSTGAVTTILRNDGYITTKSIGLSVGSISAVYLVIGVGTGGATAYSHSLGATPSFASVVNAGGFSNPQPAAPTYVSATSTTVTINAISGITFWAVLWRA